MSSLPEKKNLSTLVVRSAVGPETSYNSYLQPLRKDFFYSCAYCTITESEACKINFTIDHYEPKSMRPDLECDYSNLMYCCCECNSLKNDLTPPPEARAAGKRYFRPDEDEHSDHFDVKDKRLINKSTVGDFTITYLDLNRPVLMQMREIREKLAQCEDFVATGVLGLRHYPIDKLPPNVRIRAIAIGRRAEQLQAEMQENIDAILRAHAESPLSVEDTDKELRARERSKSLAQLRQTFPGTWRGRETRKK